MAIWRRATSRLAIMGYWGDVEACMLKFSWKNSRRPSNSGSCTWIMLAWEKALMVLCVLWVL